MKIFQNMTITVFAVFVCIFYPDYLLIEDLCQFIDMDGTSINEENDLREWKDIKEVEAEDLMISSKIFEYIKEYRR